MIKDPVVSNAAEKIIPKSSDSKSRTHSDKTRGVDRGGSERGEKNQGVEGGGDSTPEGVYLLSAERSKNRSEIRLLRREEAT